MPCENQQAGKGEEVATKLDRYVCTPAKYIVPATDRAAPVADEEEQQKELCDLWKTERLGK